MILLQDMCHDLEGSNFDHESCQPPYRLIFRLIERFMATLGHHPQTPHHFIITKLYCGRSSKSIGLPVWNLVCVYGELVSHKRREFWEHLSCIISRLSLPISCFGDFNVISSQYEMR